LFSCYPDIDYHSRIPLIASVTATLVKNGYNPTTRSEIYNFRLELLLSKWDRVRGVSRIQIDNPKAKIRFLKDLAFKMHSFETRNRFIEISDLRNTYEESLGSWGYEFDFQTFINDIVVGSGVLLKVGDKNYSFGHLSFQEHLAGEYLSEKSSLKTILGFLGNDWWREPLIFWASNKGSITGLLDMLLESGEYHCYSEQLLEMVNYAPYTSAGIVEILKEGKYVNEI
jgi:predicted NACHT family NTPase